MIKFLVILVLIGLARCQFGAQNPVNMSDPDAEKDINRLAEFALKEIANKRMTTAANEGQPSHRISYSLVKIVSARSQIVSGVKYFITIQFRDSMCPKASSASVACNQPEQCEVGVWEQVWLNHTELTSVECKQKAVLVGGRQRISNKDKNALQALDFAVAKMNTDAVNDRAYFKPSQIFNIYKQVVNGIKYTFVFKHSPTNCEKHEDLSILKTDDCVFVTPTSGSSADVAKSRNCKVSVHDQPWLANSEERYKLTNVNCF